MTKVGEAPDSLEEYNLQLVPKPFGLDNPGVLCYFNSLIQALVSCSSIVRAAFAHRDYLARTKTGQAFYNFVWHAAVAARPQGSAPFANIPLKDASAHLLRSLKIDRVVSGKRYTFGFTQESASECLSFLLDAMDAPPAEDPKTGEKVYEKNPISYLLYHRYVATIWCCSCKQVAAEPQRGTAIHFELFHYDQLKQKPSTPAKYSETVRYQISKLTDYRCGNCNSTAAAVREYRTEMIPEIVICVFNIYTGGGLRNPSGTRTARYFSRELVFRGLKNPITYLQVAQVEHFGSLGGGHYIAKGLRGDGNVYSFNDSGVSLSRFEPTPNVYMVFYHCQKNGEE